MEGLAKTIQAQFKKHDDRALLFHLLWEVYSDVPLSCMVMNMDLGCEDGMLVLKIPQDVHEPSQMVVVKTCEK